MQTSKGRRKGPPKAFDSVREAKTALTNLADSLSTHSFTWPAAALRSYLAGGSKSLDEAFGLPEKIEPKRIEKKPAAKKQAAAPAPKRKQRK